MRSFVALAKSSLACDACGGFAKAAEYMFHSAERPRPGAVVFGSKLSMAERKEEKAFDSEGVRRTSATLLVIDGE